MSSTKSYLGKKCNHTYRYLDDIISINNPNLAKYVHAICPIFLELLNVMNSDDGTYLDLYQHKGKSGELQTKLYEKHSKPGYYIR